MFASTWAVTYGEGTTQTRLEKRKRRESDAMIIWGFRMIYRTLSSGVFLCPQEGADRPYALKTAQRFFTLFFIPLIPLKKVGNVVECQSCKTKFQETVLNRPTVSQQSNSLAEAVRGAAIAVLRSGTVSDLGKEQTMRLVSQYVPGYNTVMLESDIAQFDLAPLQPQLRSLSVSLDDHGKEGLLTRLVLVALADKGGVNEAERNVLQHFGNDLGMTPAHCRGTIDSVIDQATKS